MESEPIVTRITDSIQQAQQQQHSPRNESQTGNSSDKSSAEETTNESNKAGNTPNGDECQKSQGWKGFSLKRQLSKVDMKIKNTFTPSSVSSQNGVLVCFFFSMLYLPFFMPSLILSFSCFYCYCVVYISICEIFQNILALAYDATVAFSSRL